MADDDTTPSTTGTASTAPRTQSPSTNAEKPAGDGGKDGNDKDAGKSASRRGQHRSGADSDSDRSTGRTTGGTTPAQADEYAALGVNPKLDNRTGRQRPQASALAPKPQQFPGPEVGHFAEHAESADTFESAVDSIGMHSYGPHGRGTVDNTSTAGADGNPE